MQVFAELPSLGFIKCASLIGNNNSQEMRTSQMQDTIAKFRDGRVRFLPYLDAQILLLGITYCLLFQYQGFGWV